MTAATQEQPARPNPPHAMSSASPSQPQRPPTGEPPPAETDGPEHPTDEPGYGHGV